MNDGRKDFAEIAEEIGVSKNTIWKHYKEMKKSGIIVGATTQINFRDLGYLGVAEIVASIDIAEKDQIEELIHQIPTAEFSPAPTEGRSIVNIGLRIKELSEIDRVKRILGKHVRFGEMKTYIWTNNIRNIPENLSFGLSEKCINKFSETQSQPTIDTPRRINEVDETDIKIIDKLTENGRSPFSRIAKDIGVTTDTVARRYRRLKRNGTVNIAIQISPEKIGYHANLECFIRLQPHKDTALVTEALCKIPDVFCVSGTTGESDFHVWALIRDIEHLFTTQKKILAVPDFARMDLDINSGFLKIYPSPHQHISTI